MDWLPLYKRPLPRKLKQQRIRARRICSELRKREHHHLGPFKDENGNGRFMSVRKG